MVEVDFLPASQSKSADAILIRVGTFSYENPLDNDQKVILIDSGYKECAETIKEHLCECYGCRKPHIDYVFITHPDRDHIAGFNALLDDKNVSIGHVYIHDPWERCKEIFHRDDDGRRTRKSVERKIDEAFENLGDVLEKLDDRKIPHEEFFAGDYKFVDDYVIDVLGPSEDYYKSLVKDFVLEDSASQGGESVYEEKPTLARPDDKSFLREPTTSPKNRTSMILLLSRYTDGNQEPLILFTGDAGADSLERAYKHAVENGTVNLEGLQKFQLPHHGSVKNVSRGILKNFNPESYVVSASTKEEQHPSKPLINYIVGRLNKSVLCATEDCQLCLRFDEAPSRGWESAQKMEKFLTLKKLKGDV
ncbi:MAG: MBL fold metallo-hydrolase [Candidatus Saccharibacteria bacterium]|nr:MBL fold metallo-hydrolase [Candidatus Saccharibacteria bacterium]